MKLLPLLIGTLSLTLLSAQDLTISGKQLSDKGGKVVIASDPHYSLIASVKNDQLSITFSDGKQKFGSPQISIKNGNVTYKRPRLLMTVPIKEVKAVKKGSPLLLSKFQHQSTSFELHLVKVTGSLPDLVITKK